MSLVNLSECWDSKMCFLLSLSVQKPEDEILSRKVLFDAVLLVDYPFLYSNAKYIKNLTLTRLIATHEAVEYFRYDAMRN